MKTFTFTATDAQVEKLIAHLSATSGEVDRRVADELREQVKPAIDEPAEFGSVVRATNPYGERCLWMQTGGDPDYLHNWISEGERESRRWSQLSDVEVLRIGVGEAEAASADEWARLDAANDDTDAYAKGAQDTLSKVRGCLQLLRVEAITYERKSALDKAYAAVEELTP